jgi:hypothetical protein
MRARSVLVVAAAAVVLAGCARSTGEGQRAVAGGDAKSAISSATAQMAAARTAKVSIDTKTTIKGTPVRYTMSGVMTVNGLEADVSGTLPAGTFPNIPVALTMRVISYHGTDYYHYAAPGLPDQWFKSVHVEGGSGPGSADAQLKALSAIDDLTKVGPETVRGVATTHYSGELNPKGAAEAVHSLGGKPGTKVTVPVDVWIDGRGRVFRQSESIDPGPGGFQGPTTMTVDFLSWGVALKITPPKNAKDISSLNG